MAENAEKRKRTKGTMKKALIALCRKKHYLDITVQDICDQADLYRSTFYRYYDTKDDILREIENEYIEDTRALTPTFWNIHSGSSPEEIAQYRSELIADLEYHKAHRDLCSFLLSPAGDIYFYNKMVESISKSAKKKLRSLGKSSPDNEDYFANFLAAGFVSTIQKWLRKNDCSAAEIADFLLALIHSHH